MGLGSGNLWQSRGRGHEVCESNKSSHIYDNFIINRLFIVEWLLISHQAK